jgi:hypothetical protein
MDQPLGLLVAFVSLVAVLFGLFASGAALFPRWVWLSQRAVEESPGRSLAIGAVNTIFLTALAVTLFATELPLLAILGSVVALLGLAGLALGLSGVVTMVGTRLAKHAGGLKAILTGTAVLSLASATPFLGWFLVLPGVIFLGLGGFILGWVRRRAWSAEL